MEFKMERQGLLEVGQKVQVTEGELPVSYYYTIVPAVAMSKNYKAEERLHCTEGVVLEINTTPRGFYATVAFEDE